MEQLKSAYDAMIYALGTLTLCGGVLGVGLKAWLSANGLTVTIEERREKMTRPAPEFYDQAREPMEEPLGGGNADASGDADEDSADK